MQTLRVTSKKYFNSLINGNLFNLNLGNFTTNLVGVINDYIKAEFVLEISWESTASVTNPFTVTERGNGEYEISRATGSFRNDGWSVGNKFDFVDDDRLANPPDTNILPATGNITFISDEGGFMFVTSNTDLTVSSPYEAHRLRANMTYPENNLNAILYQPNLIENNTPFTNVSLQNNVPIEWYATGIRSTTPVQMSPRGVNESFDSGDVEINYEGNIGDYIQSYKISHTFIIHPFYTVENGFDLPDYLNGTSLKYVFLADFRTAISNSSSSKRFLFENDEGIVGHFRETAIKTPTEIESSFSGRLSANRPKNITIELRGAPYFNSQDIGDVSYRLIFTKIPTLEEYSANGTFFENFDYFWEGQIGGSQSSFPGRLNTMESNLVGNDLVVEASFDAFTGYTVNDEYALMLMIGSRSNIDERTVLLLDRTTFEYDVENNGLIDLSMSITDYHGNINPLAAHNEDGLSVNFNFSLDLEKQAFLNSLSASLVAYNPTTEDVFQLDTFKFTIQDTVVNGVQQLTFNESRGYPIPNTMFNLASIANSTRTGDIQNYIGTIGQKISWQEWIANSDVPDVFFNTDEPNDNKNLKSSNYSLKEGYQIRIRFEASLSGELEDGTMADQVYTFDSEPIEIYDYNEDGSPVPAIVGTIETYDLEGNTLEGNLLKNTDTIFRIVWEDTTAPIETLGATSVTHRIEVFEQNGYRIFEISSNKDDTFLAAPLKYNSALAGAIPNRVNLRIEDGKIISECLVDGNKLTADRYSLSGKITKV